MKITMWSKKFTTITTALLCLMTISTQLYAKVLNIKNVVAPKKEHVVLKDIVENYQILTEEQQNYVVMTSPTHRDINISLDELIGKLQQYKDLHSFEVNSINNIRVKKVKSYLYLQRTKDQLIKHLKSNAPWSDWEIDVIIAPNDELLIAQTGAFNKVTFSNYDMENYVGNVAFTASFYDEENDMINQFTLTPKILKREKVCVAKTQLERNTLIKESDLKMVPTWVGNQKKSYITDKNLIIGKELAKKVSSGSIINNSVLLNPMCVKKNQMLWVELNKGTLKIKLMVKALEGGRLGDTIRVKNSSSQKVFNVELTGSKQAVVSL
ncbi:flagellar basal body P-ring formation chaperone FlgA [Lentisphaerota bacterium WC36G]|nr:flagellar basal body P-ring formation chaperone FlgA [Lentisphaerae bacterium WC36]